MGVFLVFLNYANGTKSRNASQSLDQKSSPNFASNHRFSDGKSEGKFGDDILRLIKCFENVPIPSPYTIYFLIPAGNFMFKVNNRNTRTRCEIGSKLTIKTPKLRHWGRSGVFIVKFEHISQLALEFLLLTLSR